MKKYSTNSICSKCGCTVIGTEHYDGWVGEFIKRHCTRCHFEWTEECLDKSDE